MSSQQHEGASTVGKRPRVAVAAVFHETNSFSPIKTTLDDFTRRWHVGTDLFDAQQGTRTVVGGFCDGGAQQGFELIPVFGTFATPAGLVTGDAFTAITQTLELELEGCGQVDGVLLELHGDFVTAEIADAEEHLTEIVRRIHPEVPIVCVLDFHANMDTPRLKNTNVIVGYRTNPHIDTYDRGVEAADLLSRILTGKLRPYRAHRGIPVAAAPAAQLTSIEPMLSLLSLADELRANPAIESISVHAGYPYADRDYTGMGFTAITDVKNQHVAERAVSQLHEAASRLWPMFACDFPDAKASMAEATKSQDLVVIADTGDNINGGATGDATWLLHEATLYPDHRFLTTLADAEGLAKAIEAGEGSTLWMVLGGKSSPRSGKPFAGEAAVIRITNGVFTNTGPMANGASVSMHGAAWVRIANCDIVIQGAAVQPNDTNLFQSLGIQPADYSALILKGAAALRAAWSTLTMRFVNAGTEGETDAVLSRLPFQHAKLLNLDPPR